MISLSLAGLWYATAGSGLPRPHEPSTVEQRYRSSGATIYEDECHSVRVMVGQESVARIQQRSLDRPACIAEAIIWLCGWCIVTIRWGGLAVRFSTVLLTQRFALHIGCRPAGLSVWRAGVLCRQLRFWSSILYPGLTLIYPAAHFSGLRDSPLGRPALSVPLSSLRIKDRSRPKEMGIILAHLCRSTTASYFFVLSNLQSGK